MGYNGTKVFVHGIPIVATASGKLNYFLYLNC